MACFLIGVSAYLTSLIVKTGDDMLQEQFAMQLLSQIQAIFLDAELPLQMRTYRILATGPDSGLIETVPDAVSLHGLKKTRQEKGLPTSLRKYFEDTYGGKNDPRFKAAQQNFVESLASYSIATYILQVKDRHNGNILVDTQGRLIHIDFGFLLGASPGGMNFETAPFKLTQEMLDVMDGMNSQWWNYYVSLCVRGFQAVRENHKKLTLLIDMALPGFASRFQCFSQLQNPAQASDGIRARLKVGSNVSNREVVSFVMDLIDQSWRSYTTLQYDMYQKVTNNILY